nr:aldo/keto reductase [uncultured Selenomonas sp.]
MDTIILGSGIRIPALGFGPGLLASPTHFNISNKFLRQVYHKCIYKPMQKREYIRVVTSAVYQGFRLIDYSASYGDGTLLRKGIRESGIPREKLTLTTRVSNQAQYNGETAIRKEFFNQLKGIGVDYIDILMFHWPVEGYYENTWKVMVDLYREGYVKVLGVANCHAHHLDTLADLTEETPYINQFEIHPLFTQKPLIQYCMEHGIRPEAYTPVARFDDRLVRLPLLHRIASKYNKSILQVVLRWHIQNGVIPIVRTFSPKHQKENLNIFDFSLTSEEISAIDKININARLRYDPDNCDFSIL